MVISDKKVPVSRPEPLTPSVSFAPPSRLRLHNFDIPLHMTWGTHQVLRCLDINRKGEIITDNRRSNLLEASTNFPDQIRLDETHVSISDNPISDEGKTNFLVQLRDAAVITDNINQSGRHHQSDDLRGCLSATPPVPIPVHIPPNSPSIVTRPCNRRTRRLSSHKTPCCNASPPPPPPPLLRKSVRKRSVCLMSDNASPPQPPPPPPPLRKSLRKRSVCLKSDNLEKQEHYPKISISLSRKEIKEDIYTLTGLPPCRRPKKRPRVIKRQLDSNFSLARCCRPSYHLHIECQISLLA